MKISSPVRTLQLSMVFQVVCFHFNTANALDSNPNPDRRPLIVAHRGASGILPEHTVAAYRQAIDDGADYVECDVTLTRDLVPVCIHENWLKQTTDVEERSEFSERRRNVTFKYGGVVTEVIDDWFAVDFTLAELKTLRTKQRYEFRDRSWDGKYPIATLEEHLTVVRNSSRAVGTYPELKDPEWTNSLDIMKGRRFEDIVLDMLTRYGYSSRTNSCFIQSFSQSSLEYVASRTQLRLIMLIETPIAPSKLVEWKNMGFYGVGPWIDLITPIWNDVSGYKNRFNVTTDLVEQCHRNGLQVHAYTFRNEDRYLPWNFNQDINKAYEFYFRKADVDGFFTDFPETLVNFRRVLEASSGVNCTGTTTPEINSGLILVNARLTLMFCLIVSGSFYLNLEF